VLFGYLIGSFGGPIEIHEATGDEMPEVIEHAAWASHMLFSVLFSLEAFAGIVELAQDFWGDHQH